MNQMTQFFVDSHCHLDDAQFDADREEVIERARAGGLLVLLTVGGGSGPDDLAAGVPIAERYDWIYTSAGIHPHEAKGAGDKHFDMLRRAAGGRKFWPWAKSGSTIITTIRRAKSKSKF